MQVDDKVIYFYGGDSKEPVACTISKVVGRDEVHELDKRGTDDLTFYELEACDGSHSTILPASSVIPYPYQETSPAAKAIMEQLQADPALMTEVRLLLGEELADLY